MKKAVMNSTIRHYQAASSSNYVAFRVIIPGSFGASRPPRVAHGLMADWTPKVGRDGDLAKEAFSLWAASHHADFRGAQGGTCGEILELHFQPAKTSHTGAFRGVCVCVCVCVCVWCVR